jgi:hypothetical protein
MVHSEACAKRGRGGLGKAVGIPSCMSVTEAEEVEKEEGRGQEVRARVRGGRCRESNQMQLAPHHPADFALLHSCLCPSSPQLLSPQFPLLFTHLP